MIEKETKELRAEKLKALRQAHGLTQKKAAYILDMDFLDYSYYELGKMKISDKIMVQVARYARMNVEYLVNDMIGIQHFEIFLNATDA